MPGLVVFRRRWSVGSDDLVVPGVFLSTVHLIWTIILSVILSLVNYDRSVYSIFLLWCLIIGYLVILIFSMLIELVICVVAMRGSILDTGKRASMQYILYLRLTVMLVEAAWLSAGIAWLVKYYLECPIDNAKEIVLVMVVFNWCILFSVIITVWCTYDSAGRSWVKMKQYQRSMRESESKFQYKRSGSTRNWRQRKVLRAYQDSWHNRCRFLFCCSTSDRNRNSFTDIARLLSDFFRDLDVVPSDVIVGLVLLRKFQKIERKAIVEQRKNDTYEFLSGVAITPSTQFLSLHEEGADLELFQSVIHFAHFAVKAYGWPVFIINNPLGMCKLCPSLRYLDTAVSTRALKIFFCFICCFRCCCCVPIRHNTSPQIVDDNCCHCNYAATEKLSIVGDIEIIYATYHVDIGQTPFFVALDYGRKKIVISIRGTLSMKDILTDLNAEGETLPLNPPKEDWLGHKGMVQAAQYILEILDEEQLVERAWAHNPERGTREFELVIVGHSLGAGTASILGILLRQRQPTLQCFCYSPPGGLLSAPAVDYTKEFTVSVVVGKDVVPRIGLYQMETLRTDLINAIKRSVDPKWKTISCSVLCCGCSQPTSAVELSTGEKDVTEYMRSKEKARAISIHPSDCTIALSSHPPLYPPGRMIHIVRHHPTSGQQSLNRKGPVYQALWARNTDFDEVLISPVMVTDHMPDKLLDALNKVVTSKGPKKPQRSASTSEPSSNYYSAPSLPNCLLETSFTSLQSPSSNSSITNGYYSTRSQQSPVSSTPNIIYPKQLPSREEPKTVCRSLSLSLKSTTSTQRAELIHDDWLGLAPLASPESLSELSSISSRASLVTTSNVIVEINRTPKIIRRTPKIIGNLSSCADDIRNIRNFQKAKTFRTRLITNNNIESSSSSNLSYESASSSTKCCTENGTADNSSVINKCCEVDNETSDAEFQSAEDILDNVLASAGCKEFFNSDSNILEVNFDFLQDQSAENITSGYYANSPNYPTVMSPCSPLPIDQDMISNLAIDLNLDEDHRSIKFQRQPSSQPSSSVDSGSVCRTPSDITKNVTFNPEVITVDAVIRERRPSPPRWRQLFRGKASRQRPEATSPIVEINTSAVPIKTILSVKRKSHEDLETSVPSDLPLKSALSKKNNEEGEQCFSRTEQLPLLSGLNNSTSERKPSPCYVRRKKYVYPSDVVMMTQPNESAV
ncbi:diacylglycerol lipase-alpha isoform X2 [Diorhabda sublineata]|uniref:diacylglycerol lipase-alpha isoform X2 n=1 Tax=Diorhabda sublineata TaxID=1163346 RepID=UPI0024E052CC|nr:diacylglycerol lipase-alpha isoform X2 [Diorhabda sublineata]